MKKIKHETNFKEGGCVIVAQQNRKSQKPVTTYEISGIKFYTVEVEIWLSVEECMCCMEQRTFKVVT